MSATVALFRETLKHAAANYAPHYPEDGDTLTALCKAAAEYAEARLASAKQREPQSFARPKSGVLVPFGRAKGMDVTEASDDDLRWISGALQTSIDNPEKERWRQGNVDLKAAVDSELRTR